MVTSRALSRQFSPASISLSILSLCGSGILLAGDSTSILPGWVTARIKRGGEGEGGKDVWQQQRQEGNLKKMPAGQAAFLEQSAATIRHDWHSKAHSYLFHVMTYLGQSIQVKHEERDIQCASSLHHLTFAGMSWNSFLMQGRKLNILVKAPNMRIFKHFLPVIIHHIQ